MKSVNQNTIKLREARRIGDVVGDTIQFIKQNFKDIIKNTVFIALPLFILAGVLLAMKYFPAFHAHATVLSVAGYLLTFFVTTFFYGLIIEYIVLYVKNNNASPGLETLLKAVRKDILMIIMTNILNLFFLGVSFLIFVIPGFYLMIPLSMLLIIRINERSNYFAALDKSMRLITGNWWKSLGMYLIFGILMMLIAGIIYTPFIIINAIGELHNADIKNTEHIATRVVMEFSNQLFNILYLIPILGSSVLYFSLLEQKEGAGLLEKIQNFRKKHESK